MAVTLSPSVVTDLTGVTDVSSHDITLAGQLIDDQTGYTPDEHNTTRAIPELTVLAAWSMVAVRVHRMLTEDISAVTSETQGDYSYSEDAGLANVLRFSNVCDGRPLELLNVHRARWAHI